MTKCCGCRAEIEDAASAIVCSECEFCFHASVCSGMSEQEYAEKKKSFKKRAWKCEACRPGASKSTTRPADQIGDAQLKITIMDIDKKLTSLLTLNEKVEGIDRSIQLLSDHFDKIQERLSGHDREIKNIKCKIDKLEKEDPAKGLAQLQIDFDDLEWRSRRLNVEIHGIPETAGENLLNKVNDLAKTLSLTELAPADISAIHRMASRPGRERGVILRFVHQDLRNMWLEKRKSLRQEQENVYITENMTKRSRALLLAAKTWARRVGYDFAWHSNGKVLVRRKSGERAQVIRCEDDLSALSN